MIEINLEGKRAVVCGSTQGIGKAIAIMLANAGASITLISRDNDKLKKVLTELNTQYDQKHLHMAADFSNPAILKVKMENYVKKNPINHILVNNTGGPPAGLAIDSTTEQFLHAFNSHLICNHILVQYLSKGMKESGYGRIINVISTSVKQPITGLGVSNTIRAAVGNWSKTLAGELAPFQITVNNILPGATATSRLSTIIDNKVLKSAKDKSVIEDEMTNEIPMRRFAQPEEIANAALFLASSLSSYVTGTNIVVDGGRTGNL